MCSTLFRVPLEIAIGAWGLPLFGWGILLAVWAAVGGAALLRSARQQGVGAALVNLGPSLAIVGAVILWVAPALAEEGGVPVRGYGVMLLAAAAAGTWLSVRRGRTAGFDADTILGLGLWIFVAGLVGARLFFVIEYHDEFFRPGEPLGDSLARAAFVPNGGLVVFGALPTAALAAWWYARKRGLPLLRLADVIAPGLLLGLAIGRVGCFLNGCCYGGPTDLPWGVTFPPGSPPAVAFPATAGSSVAVHPAQLYAAVDAALLGLMAVAFTPYARRDGAVFALVLTLHPLSRILLEIIRVDEPPALGTPLSISQLVSIVLLGLAAALWWWVYRGPAAPLGFDAERHPTPH
jgi:phosphatidylglycerol:prolipoprotein diacylglycerol transferase